MLLGLLRGSAGFDAEHPMRVGAPDEAPLLDAEPRRILQFLGLGAGLARGRLQDFRRSVGQPQQPVDALGQGGGEGQPVLVGQRRSIAGQRQINDIGGGHRLAPPGRPHPQPLSHGERGVLYNL